MRPLARYALTGKIGDSGIPPSIDALASSIDTWLTGKGWTDHSQPQFSLQDGRLATIERVGVASGAGRIERWLVKEPINEGRTQFSTHISVCFTNTEVAVFCELGAINVHS